jgi:signal transduction histidine kinase
VTAKIGFRTLFSKKEFAGEPLNPTDAAREVLALTVHELQRHQIAIVTEFAKYPVDLTGDRVQIQQVILNLLLNAADAIKQTADSPRTITIETATDGQRCGKLTVRDNGVGISPESLGKLSNAFYTTKPHGMGIGLSVSHSIVERHHDRLRAASNEGAGATFWFTIPATI